MSDITLQNVSEKLANKLDDIESSVKDGLDNAASKESVETLQGELDNQRKQMQEIAESAKRVHRTGDEQKERNREFAEVVLKAQSEGTDAAGGYSVPDEFITQIHSTQNNYGAVRRIWGDKIIPLKSDVTKIPVRSRAEGTDAQPTVAQISENAQLSDSQGKISQVTLTAKKYGTLVYVSSELIADSFLDYIGGYLRDQIAHEASQKEDDLVFNTGAGALLVDMSLNQVLAAGDGFEDVTIEDLRAMQDKVNDEALDAGAYYCHRSVRTQIANIRSAGSAAGDGPFTWGNPNVGIPATLDGYNVEHVGKMPANSASASGTSFVLFGDLPSATLVGERGDAQLSLSDHLRFDYDQTAVRYMFRFAYGGNEETQYASCFLTTN